MCSREKWSPAVYSHSLDNNLKSLQSNVYFIWQIMLLRTFFSVLIVLQAGWTQFTMEIRESAGKSNFKEKKIAQRIKHPTFSSSFLLFFVFLFVSRSLTVVRRVPNGNPHNLDPYCTEKQCTDNNRTRMSFPHSQPRFMFQCKIE